MKLILPLVFLVTAAAVAAVAIAAGGSSGRTIHVIEHATTDLVSNDALPPGDSAGDILTFANELFDKTNKKHTGHDQGYCVRTQAAKAWECVWTNFLAGGQITVEGPFYDTRNSRLAVTGGTGGYANARGWMQLKSRAGGTQFDFIFHLS